MINMLSPSWKRSRLRNTVLHAQQDTRRSLSAAVCTLRPQVRAIARPILLSLTLMTTFALLIPNPLKAQNSEAAKGGVRRATHSNPRFTKRPPETDHDITVAVNELGKFAALHNVDIDETWRADGESPWTARLINVNDQSEAVTTWEEIGYDRLINAVKAVETAYSFCHNGGTGTMTPTGNHHLQCN